MIVHIHKHIVYYMLSTYARITAGKTGNKKKRKERRRGIRKKAARRDNIQYTSQNRWIRRSRALLQETISPGYFRYLCDLSTARRKQKHEIGKCEQQPIKRSKQQQQQQHPLPSPARGLGLIGPVPQAVFLLPYGGPRRDR